MNVASAYTPARPRTPTPKVTFNGVEPRLSSTSSRSVSPSLSSDCTYGSADSYYYYLYAGSLHQVEEGWWVYEGCIAAEGWMIVH